MIRVCFFGTSKFVEPVREAIKNSFELTEDFKNSDLIVVASYGKILSKEIIESPKYGAINIHPSDLPKYRGPSPIQMQIIDGVKKSAVAFIKMDEEVDHGSVLKKIPFEILDDDTFQSLVDRVFILASENIVSVIEGYINKQIDPVPQDHTQATFTRILKKEDGFINLNHVLSSEILEKMIRAYFPWPGVWTKLKINSGEKIIKLLPNKMIQVEGKNPMSYTDFINGYGEGRQILNQLGQLD